MQVDYDDEVCFHAARALRPRADPPRGRSCSSPRSPTRTTPGSSRPAGGSATTRTTSICPRSRRSRSTRPTRTAAGCGACAASTTAELTDDQVRRARHAYFARDLLRRRPHRPGARRAARLGPRGGHDRRLHRGSRRDARRAGPLVQDGFFEDSARVPLVVRAPGGLAGRGAGSRSRCSTSPRRWSTSPGSTRPIRRDRRPEPRAGAARGGPPRRARRRRVPGRGRRAPRW